MNERWAVTATFGTPGALLAALDRLRAAGVRDFEVFSPYPLVDEEARMPRRGSTVRAFAVAGGVVGAAGAFALCIATSVVFNLIVGGKRPAAIVPYCIVGFEATILLAALLTVAGLVFLARMRPKPLPDQYRRDYSDATFGLHANCPRDQASAIASLLRKSGAEEVNEH